MSEKDLLKEQNKLLRREIALLKLALCRCPRNGDWVIVGISILCPVHNKNHKII
jgi:hypothetical protein